MKAAGSLLRRLKRKLTPSKDPSDMNILVSGTTSGLGRSLCTHFHGQALRRSPDALAMLIDASHEMPIDMIIHTAFSTAKRVDTTYLHTYLNDTLFLTEQLTRIRHHRFVFISSTDVYPKNGELHTEDEIISLSDL